MPRFARGVSVAVRLPLALLLLVLYACNRPKSDQLRERAETLLRAGNPQAAREELERALRFDPNDEEAGLRLMDLLFETQQWNEASRVLARLPTEMRQSRAMRTWEARLQLETGAFPRSAIRLFRERALGVEVEEAVLRRATQQARLAAGGYFLEEDFPRPWAERVFSRLLEQEQWNAMIAVCADERHRQSFEKECERLLLAMKFRSFSKFEAGDLIRLTRSPRLPEHYLARLDALLRLGRINEARALRPVVLEASARFFAEWDTSWAAYYLANQDYESVLSGLDKTIRLDGETEALRHALRVVAHAQLRGKRRALIETRLWAQNPEAALRFRSIVERATFTSHRALLLELWRAVGRPPSP
jgi:tetratricopeptide (TPR) repeat protein